MQSDLQDFAGKIVELAIIWAAQEEKSNKRRSAYFWSRGKEKLYITKVTVDNAAAAEPVKTAAAERKVQEWEK